MYVVTRERGGPGDKPDDLRGDEIEISIRVTDVNDNPHWIDCPKELLLMPVCLASRSRRVRVGKR